MRVWQLGRVSVIVVSLGRLQHGTFGLLTLDELLP
jgi:hypothetical protein